MKVKKMVTVTFMSGPTEKARQWTFPRWLFHAFFVMGILLVTAGISLGFFYVHEAQKLVTYRHLIRQTAEQKSHLDQYRKELEGLEAQLSEVNLLDGQIRQMTAGQQSPQSPKVPGNSFAGSPPAATGTNALPANPSAGVVSPSSDSGSGKASSIPLKPVSKGILYVLPPGEPGAWAYPLAGWETSPFGNRKSPLGDGEEFHTGLDIAQVEGARVFAAADGSVMEVGKAEDYGRFVIVYHGLGVTSLYAHLGSVLVHPGEHVGQGTPLGYVGMSGLTNGPHLHFEIRYFGVPVDPAKEMEQENRAWIRPEQESSYKTSDTKEF